MTGYRLPLAILFAAIVALCLIYLVPSRNAPGPQASPGDRPRGLNYAWRRLDRIMPLALAAEIDLAFRIGVDEET